MAKKVIKNHKENQEKLSSKVKNPEKSPPLSMFCLKFILTSIHILFHACLFLIKFLATKKSGNGPGKALRQENSFSSQHDSFDSGKNFPISELTTTLKSTSISSKSYNSNIITAPNPTSNIPTAATTSNNNNNNSNVKELVTVSTTSLSSNNSTNTSILSRIESTSNTSTAYINANEDSNKIEKFKSILAVNPINLEELQKASWKGIPKCFRPICWKLLSVGL